MLLNLSLHLSRTVQLSAEPQLYLRVPGKQQQTSHRKQLIGQHSMCLVVGAHVSAITNPRTGQQLWVPSSCHLM
jgi:hypothetical protein